MPQLQIADCLHTLRKISEGATSVVYLARVTKDLEYAQQGQQVAVKLFRQPPAGEWRDRFERELEIGLTVRSHHLVRYLSRGEFHSDFGYLPFIVEEYIDGVGLKETLRAISAFEPQEASTRFLDLLSGVASALATLHSKGIVHRDLQPANIIVRKSDETAVLVDYGTSKYLEDAWLSSPWEEIGTRRYWAPECLSDAPASWYPATDVFMLGSCLLHMLTGNYLFNDARNYPAFYRRLAEYGAGNADPEELELLPSWIGEHGQAMVRAMLYAKETARPPANQIQHLASGNVRPVPPLMEEEPLIERHEFPLGVFLWRLEEESEVGALQELARIAESEGLREIAFQRLSRLLSIETVRRLCGWGLLEPLSDAEFYVYDFGGLLGPAPAHMPVDLERIENPHLRFRLCDILFAVAVAVARDEGIWRRVAEIRREFKEMSDGGLVQHCHYDDWDSVTIGDESYVLDSCDHQIWLPRIALAVGRLEPALISGVGWSRYPC